MTAKTVDYPHLFDAIERITPLAGTTHSPGCSSYRRCELCVAKADALNAYALELLPEIMPGTTWKIAQGTTFPSRRFRWFAQRPLFDHWHVYRRQGARGGNTWRNSAVISYPCGVLDNAGAVCDEAVAQAKQFRGTDGVSVWVRGDLSSHFPGATQLVIVAFGLDDFEAVNFGFQTI
jgi:hypothetical protein